MLNLNNFSTTNLEKIQRILKLILDNWELQKDDIEKMERLIEDLPFREEERCYERPPISISKERLQKEDFTLDEAKTIIRKLYEVRKHPYEVVKKYPHEVTKHLHEVREPLHLLEDDIYFQKKCAEVEGFREGMEKSLKEEVSIVIVDIERLKKLYENIETKLKRKQLKKKVQKKLPVIPKFFEIQVKDRYIWINNYLLSKPHAVGSNFEFFEYIRSHPGERIERENLPSQFGTLSLKAEVKNKSFIKILNELGFKDEILKAFFPKRGKDMLVYRGDKITQKDLEKSGIKIPLFLKELELAHIKNNPNEISPK